MNNGASILDPRTYGKLRGALQDPGAGRRNQPCHRCIARPQGPPRYGSGCSLRRHHQAIQRTDPPQPRAVSGGFHVPAHRRGSSRFEVAICDLKALRSGRPPPPSFPVWRSTTCASWRRRCCCQATSFRWPVPQNRTMNEMAMMDRCKTVSVGQRITGMVRARQGVDHCDRL